MITSHFLYDYYNALKFARAALISLKYIACTASLSIKQSPNGEHKHNKYTSTPTIFIILLEEKIQDSIITMLKT
jgi:hypothetical protein